MIERFTRVDEERILYAFTIEDPTIYTQPWGREIPFKRLDDVLYQYACHEGNHALNRRTERRALPRENGSPGVK